MESRAGVAAAPGGAPASLISTGAAKETEVRHRFTVDVEEWFHAHAMAEAAPRISWPRHARRSPRVIDLLLEVLAEHDARATFFVLGWLAEREPAMVRAIARAGHEVASHSWDHTRITRQSRPELRESLRRSKGVLEDLTGEPVSGFRAPSFSIVPGQEWAFDVLLDEGYSYDSSVFPTSLRRSYGYPGTPRDTYRIRRPAGTLIEVPLGTLRALGANLPASGGAYFRFFPLLLAQSTLRDAARRGCPGTFYIHPWEMDDHVPDLPMGWKARIRTFTGRRRTWPGVRALLDEFRFERIDRTLDGAYPAAVLLP